MLMRRLHAATQLATSEAKSRKRIVAEGFRLTDVEVLEQCQQKQWQDGATCVAVWVIGGTAIVANVGGPLSLPLWPLKEEPCDTCGMTLLHD